MKATHLKVNEGLHVNKAPAMMAVWGVMLLLGGVIQQFLNLSADMMLIIWGVLSLIGIAGQVVCLVNGLSKNFGVWIGVIVVGWLITLYILKFDKGFNIQYAADLPAIWLGLLGIGYWWTALQVNRRFWYLSAASFAFGEFMELCVRGVFQGFGDFIVSYDKLFFGLFAGVPLIIASLPQYYKPPKKKAAPAAAAPASAPAPPQS